MRLKKMDILSSVIGLNYSIHLGNRKRIRVKKKNFRQDKVLIGGMAADITR